MQKKNHLLGAVIILFLANLCLAQANLTDKLPIAAELQIGKLPNGLTYYIRKNSKPEKKVELRLVVKVGSILEDDDQLGLAHFTEHMAFNGSKHFKKNDLVSFLQSIGVEFGADLNASTGFDETIYILPIPVDKPENLDKGLLVLEDWASTIAFETPEIEKERGVVLEEERIGKGAQERMMKKMLPYILAGSKYEKRLPIGTVQNLKTFKPEVIKRYYRDWYRPDLMSVVVVGDIDPIQVETLIKNHFEKLKVPATERPRVYADLPSRQLSEGLVITDPEATNSVLQIFYATQKAKTQTTIGDYRERIVKELSSTMLNLRMQELTQKAEPPFIFGGSQRSEFVHGYESYFGVALIGKGGVIPAINAVITENERARKYGFTAPEFERTKKSSLRNYERAYNERDKTESDSYVEEYVGNFLNEEPIPGIEFEYNYHKKFLENITLQEINEYTAKSIPSSTEKKLIVLQTPDKTDFKLPKNEELLAMVIDAEKIPVTAYEEKAVASSLMETIPTGGSITSEKKNTELGLTELILSNGIKVIIKPTDFKNDQIVLSGFQLGGQSQYDLKDMYNAQYAASIITQMGVGNFSPVDLRKVLAGKTAGASPRITNLTQGISGQSGNADIETMLQLVHLYFTKPRKDEELFKSFLTKQQAMMQNMMSDPKTVYQDSIQKILFNNNPRAPRVAKSSDLEKLNIDRILDIYKERFSNTNGWTFYIVGSVDIEKLKPLLTTYLGTIPATTAIAASYKDLGVRPIKGVVKRSLLKGNEPKSYITIIFTGEAIFSDTEQLKMQALTEYMNIKLIESLREELSGIYGGGMSGSISKLPYGSYSVNISLPCGPENVDKLIEATFNEIQKVKDKGPSEADLNKVKETFEKQHQVDMKDNNYWLARLQRTGELNLNLSDILTINSRMKIFTTKDIQDAAKKYFNTNNYFQAVLYPEK